EILQLPEQKRIVMIFEGGAHIWREIYLDGRPHPDGDALNPTFLGHSVGHWDGDTLVIDVVGFNEGSWLDPVGHPHTDMLHVIEKYSRPNKNTLHYEATIDDPGAYTSPWTVTWDNVWSPNGELAEYICQENNKYMSSLMDDFGSPQAAPTQPGHRARSPWDCREPYESAWHLARRPSTLHRSPAHLRTAHRASSLDYSRHSLASMMRPACRAASSGRNADNPCASVSALTNSETLSDPRSSLGAVVLGSVRIALASGIRRLIIAIAASDQCFIAKKCA